MQANSSSTLTSDRIFLLTYLFWMTGGCLLVIPGVMLAMTGAELFSVSRSTSDVLAFGRAILLFLGVLCVSVVLFRTGTRERVVQIVGENIIIQWGMRFPMRLRTYKSSSLANFCVTREARFVVTVSGTGRYNTRQGHTPDRFRLTAKHNNKSINLGSYTTESDAQAAITRITGAANTGSSFLQ